MPSTFDLLEEYKNIAPVILAAQDPSLARAEWFSQIQGSSDHFFLNKVLCVAIAFVAEHASAADISRGHYTLYEMFDKKPEVHLILCRLVCESTKQLLDATGDKVQETYNKLADLMQCHEELSLQMYVAGWRRLSDEEKALTCLFWIIIKPERGADFMERLDFTKDSTNETFGNLLTLRQFEHFFHILQRREYKMEEHTLNKDIWFGTLMRLATIFVSKLERFYDFGLRQKRVNMGDIVCITSNIMVQGCEHFKEGSMEKYKTKNKEKPFKEMYVFTCITAFLPGNWDLNIEWQADVAVFAMQILKWGYFEYCEHLEPAVTAFHHNLFGMEGEETEWTPLGLVGLVGPVISGIIQMDPEDQKKLAEKCGGSVSVSMFEKLAILFGKFDELMQIGDQVSNMFPPNDDYKTSTVCTFTTALQYLKESKHKEMFHICLDLIRNNHPIIKGDKKITGMDLDEFFQMSKPFPVESCHASHMAFAIIMHAFSKEEYKNNPVVCAILIILNQLVPSGSRFPIEDNFEALWNIDESGGIALRFLKPYILTYKAAKLFSEVKSMEVTADDLKNVTDSRFILNCCVLLSTHHSDLFERCFEGEEPAVILQSLDSLVYDDRIDFTEGIPPINLRNFIRHAHLFKNEVPPVQAEEEEKKGELPDFIVQSLEGNGPVTRRVNAASEAYMKRREKKIAERGLTKEQLEYWEDSDEEAKYYYIPEPKEEMCTENIDDSGYFPRYATVPIQKEGEVAQLYIPEPIEWSDSDEEEEETPKSPTCIQDYDTPQYVTEYRGKYFPRLYPPPSKPMVLEPHLQSILDEWGGVIPEDAAKPVHSLRIDAGDESEEPELVVAEAHSEDTSLVTANEPLPEDADAQFSDVDLSAQSAEHSFEERNDYGFHYPHEDVAELAEKRALVEDEEEEPPRKLKKRKAIEDENLSDEDEYDGGDSDSEHEL